MSMLKSTRSVILGALLMQIASAGHPAHALTVAWGPSISVGMSLKSQASSVQVTALTQAIPGGRAAMDATIVPATTFAQDDAARFNVLTADDKPGGFLDTALKAANLPQPIDFDPKAMDPRLVILKRSLTAYPRSSYVFVISLTWGSQDEAQSIVEALQRRYISVVGTHETLVVLDQRELDNLNKLELATLQYIADNNFHYPTLSDQKILMKQLMPYLVGYRDSSKKGGAECFQQPGQNAPYGVNVGLSDQPMRNVKDPAQTILFYETVTDKDGNRYVGYADGDCKLIVAANWDEAKKASNIP